LRFGLAALDGDQVLVLNYGADGAECEHACIFADSRHHTVEEFRGSVYERAVVQGSPLIVEDLAEMPDRTPADDEIIEWGLRNIIVAPLLYQDRVIGTLELGSPTPGDLDATLLPKLHQILPLFSMAVQRSMEELNSRIQAFIKEKCTAIHPVVEWRFRKAVLKGIEQRVSPVQRRGTLRPPPDVRPQRAGAHRGVPDRARSSDRDGVRPAAAVRGKRDADRRRHLVLPRPRGADGPDDLPALLREAEDGRRRPSDLRRLFPARGRPFRPALPQKPQALAAHGHVRGRAAGQSPQGKAS